MDGEARFVCVCRDLGRSTDKFDMTILAYRMFQ